ncbi:TPA: 30S ribosomal protein S14 [Candidatus Micrarchaeota archaeon]|nr:30S ribosomal protein S14 [Candidatus Micrarchaeota archaeon]
MVQKLETKFKKRGTRKCRFCGTARGLISKYGLYTCRRCFRERAEKIGFKKYY